MANSNSSNISSSSRHPLTPLFLPLLHPHCRLPPGNLSANPAPSFLQTSSLPVTATEEGEVESQSRADTDFGAVMYITAVLVFYSLGIVVMIVKYLKTERKEMEEEAALENFFKGIPSKRIEHEQEAVNRVAIRAFHTLTSGASRREHAPLSTLSSGGAQAARGEYRWERGCDLSLPEAGCARGRSPDPGDSDCSPREERPRTRSLQRERSKHLPRVSLMFRDSRSHDRRKMQNSVRGMRDRRCPVDMSCRQQAPPPSLSSTAPETLSADADSDQDLPQCDNQERDVHRGRDELDGRDKGRDDRDTIHCRDGQPMPPDYYTATLDNLKIGIPPEGSRKPAKELTPTTTKVRFGGNGIEEYTRISPNAPLSGINNENCFVSSSFTPATRPSAGDSPATTGPQDAITKRPTLRGWLGPPKPTATTVPNVAAGRGGQEDGHSNDHDTGSPRGSARRLLVSDV